MGRQGEAATFWGRLQEGSAHALSYPHVVFIFFHRRKKRGHQRLEVVERDVRDARRSHEGVRPPSRCDDARSGEGGRARPAQAWSEVVREAEGCRRSSGRYCPEAESSLATGGVSWGNGTRRVMRRRFSCWGG